MTARITVTYAGRLWILAGLWLAALVGCNNLPEGPAEAANMRVRGVTLVDWTPDGYATLAAAASVDAVASTGANTVTIVVTGYQSDAGSNRVRIDGSKTPTVSAVTSAIARAKADGLRVSIKPHVDLDNGGWRGTISPANPQAWFASYREFILPWAMLAESLGASEFVVGTELAGTVSEEAQWRELIRELRTQFSGDVVYAASWDEAARVPFWDAVDRVGVNFYGPIATGYETDRFDLLVGWQEWIDRLRLLHELTHRPILLTEIGYRSVDGAGLHPYDYSQDPPADLAEQADLYWAALEALGGLDWVEGAYWWDWPANGDADRDLKDFTPRGKPAEKEMADAWK